MADNETIADIIAWLRRPIAGENAYLTLWRAEIADRLEAAHRRESGDAAKLREALEKVKFLMPYFLQYMRLHWEDAEGGGYFDELMLVIDAALAAPPRICDRYATAEEARQAWLDDAGNWDEFGSPKLELHDWLLAPATEKEGGAE